MEVVPVIEFRLYLNFGVCILIRLQHCAHSGLDARDAELNSGVRNLRRIR